MILVRPSLKSSLSSNWLALVAARALTGVELWPSKIARFRKVVARPRTKTRTTHFPFIAPPDQSSVANGRTDQSDRPEIVPFDGSVLEVPAPAFERFGVKELVRRRWKRLDYRYPPAPVRCWRYRSENDRGSPEYLLSRSQGRGRSYRYAETSC